MANDACATAIVVSDAAYRAINGILFAGTEHRDYDLAWFRAAGVQP